MAKKIFLTLAVLFVACLSAVCAPKLQAFTLFPNCNDPNAPQYQSSVCQTDRSKPNNKDTNNVVLRDIKEASDVVAFLAGAIALIMIIVGGFSLVTSAGNSEKVQNARRRIVNALIGIAIIALAYAITTFIINHVVK